MRGILAFVAALGIAGHTCAAEAPAACSAPAPLPAEFAGWREAAPLAAATTPAAARSAPLVLGTARKLTLAFGSTVTNAAPPERPDAGAGKAGMVSFTVATPGTYRVALGAGAWVEVVRDGKAARSVAHGHGPECSGIRKIVDFQLAPGRYVLQLTASDMPEVTAMIVPGAAPAAPHGSAH
ncbi:MAG: hypothetical protein QM676_08360 [Novosphingobium sp.]